MSADILPEEFVQRIKGQKYIDHNSLLASLKEPSTPSIRINELKWQRKPINSVHVPWCSNGYYLSERPSYTFDPLFHAGCYYPQEASGMFIEEIIRQVVSNQKKIKVLDLCGAPGGKSTILSGIIGNDSLLIANEVIRSRADILSETLTKWGSINTMVTGNDPSVFGRLRGYFDIILVDAPCSGEGMFRNKIAINEWSVDNTILCSERQRRIVADIWPSLKEGGILIYSTCTFNPAENEENIEWLVKNRESEGVRLNVSEFNGITEIDFKGLFGYGFYPGKLLGEGFFVSVVRKTGYEKEIRFKNKKNTWQKPGSFDLRVINEWTHFREDRVIKWQDDVFSLPSLVEEFQNLSGILRIVKAGTKLFSIRKKDYIPSHDLAMSQNIRRNVFPENDISIAQSLSYLRRDNITVIDCPKGWNILTYNGTCLGFINNIGNRHNNYYPVKWRIRSELKKGEIPKIINWGS